MAAASLRGWLRLYADRGADEGAHGVSRTVRRVLQRALPLAFAEASRGAMDDWEIVVKTLEIFYEAPLGVDVAALPDSSVKDSDCMSAPFVRLLELVLGAVVQSEEKATFVRDIMTMDASVQVDLMAAIEKVMAHGVNVPTLSDNQASEYEGGGDTAALPSTSIPEARSPHPRSTTSTPDFRSPLHLSTNADFDRVKRENAVLRDENIHITEELDSARQQLQRRHAENEALSSQIQKLTQERERDLLRKEHSVRTMLDDRIQQMQRELEAVASELQAKAAIASAVPALRDEIDLLRPTAERVGKMDGKLAKYKAKIEELAGVKDKLRSVERANEELMSKNLALESRVSKSASLQRKLDEAKDANTELKFRVSELESLLTRQSHELVKLKSDLEAAESALQETKALNQQLQETVACQLNSGAMSQSESLGDGASTAIAGGISELNPELMQKLQRLEFENDELKKQLDGETSERIDSLLDQVADLKRLKKSFEGRYFDTVRQLEETQAQLEEIRDREAEVNAMLAKTQEELRSMTLLCNASDDALTKARESIDDLRVSEARLNDELLQRRQAEGALQAQLAHRDQAVEELNATVKRLQLVVSTLHERQEILFEDVASHGVERRIVLDEQLCLTRNIQHLQEALSICQADAADLQQRLTAEKEDSSSLRQQREALGMVKEDLEAQLLIERLRVDNQRSELAALAHEHEKTVADFEEKLMSATKQLLEQREVAAMQHEDSSSTLERLQQSMEGEQRALSKNFSDALTAAEEREQQLAREHEVTVAAMKRDHSGTISRMTGTIDAKSAALENATKSLSEYKQMHSVSNDEWRRRERALEAEVEHSRRVLASQEARQAELSAALHALEDNQSRLMETNHMLKAEVAQKQSRVEKLEAATTRLESKVVLLEKERAHYSRQEERQRDRESVNATFSAQQNSQIDAVTAELEKLTREHQALQVEMQACRCDRSISSAKDNRDARAGMLSPDEKKNYYRSRIRHLEQSAQQQDDKRRELLLVNAKLVQEQKQLHIWNSALSIEVQKLKEKLNRSLLRESRQRTIEHDESVHQTHTARREKRISVTGIKASTANQAMQQTGVSDAERRGAALGQENGRPVGQSHPLALGSPAGKRRRLDDVTSTTVAGEPQPRNDANNGTAAILSLSMPMTGVELASTAQHNSEVPAATSQRSKHRRLAHFFADNVPSAASTAPKDDKPAECNQQ